MELVFNHLADRCSRNRILARCTERQSRKDFPEMPGGSMGLDIKCRCPNFLVHYDERIYSLGLAKSSRPGIQHCPKSIG